MHDRVADVRQAFIWLKGRNQHVIDKSGCRMLELIGATFVADEDAIFGKVNADYVRRELQWYASQSLNINDMPGNPPKEWVRAGDANGLINSNYGWAIWSDENFSQYEHVKKELLSHSASRRAVMLYTRPRMWLDYNDNDKNDFMCTNAVQYMIRNEKLVAVIQMRSNDVVFGYRNDRAWQAHVHEMLARDLGCEKGKMVWHVGSLHVYERHFDLVV